MDKYKKIAGLLILCAGICLLGGCGDIIPLYTVRGDIRNGNTIIEPINPNHENIVYIDSIRTVSGDIVTITFQYKLEEPKEDELPEFGLSLQP